jgi:hypothetical protein
MYLIVLLAVVSLSASEWHWGSEGLQCEYVKPTGLLGCRWLNYDNGWANTPVMFRGWDKPINAGTGLCFQGSISSLMLHYGWPDQIDFNGMLATEQVSIKHSFQYDAVNNFTDGANDNPADRVIPDCAITGYSTAMNEIARLYGAVHTACNYESYNYHVLWEPYTRIKDIMKIRLGFSNVEVIASDDPLARQKVIQHLTGVNMSERQPVVAFGANHTWLIDDYRVSTDSLGKTVEMFHILSYDNSCGHHCAHWDSLGFHSPVAFITDVKPDVAVPASSTYTIEYNLGDNTVPSSSGTIRRGSFRIRGMQAETVQFGLTTTLLRFSKGSWIVDSSLQSGTFSVHSDGIVTPQFTYAVGAADSVRIRLTLVNRSANTAGIRILLNDYILETRPVPAVATPEPTVPEIAMQLVYPDTSVKRFKVGDLLPIRWQLFSKTVSSLRIYLSTNNGRTWISLLPGSAVDAAERSYYWMVPDSIDGPDGVETLVHKSVLLMIADYSTRQNSISMQAIQIEGKDKPNVSLNQNKSMRSPRPREKFVDGPYYDLRGRRVSGLYPGLMLSRSTGGYRIYLQSNRTERQIACHPAKE